MLRKPSYLPLLLCALLAGCTQGVPDTPESSRVEMTLSGQTTTRAHYEDRDGTGTFVWDTGDDMVAVISSGGSLAGWTGGGYHSPMGIYLLDPGDYHKVTRATSVLTLSADAAQTGDNIFCLSPVEGSPLCSLTETADEVKVSFGLPKEFSQSASSRLEEFAPYCFIHGESSVLSVPTAENRNFKAATTRFRAIPAVLRFNLTNTTPQDAVIESVKITCNHLFPDRLIWTATPEGISLREPEDKSGYYDTIKTTLAKGNRDTIPGKDEETASTGTYYAFCLPFDDASSMTGATLAFILESKEKIWTFNVPAEEFFRTTETKSFESNRIYTFNFSLTESSVELESVSISDWKDEPFYLPTEEVSVEFALNATYWVQDRINLYTYGFMQMTENASSRTLWAECNLGEYLYSSSEQAYRWSETTPKYEGDTDYLAGYYGGLTDFKWATPAREDFLALLNEDTMDIRPEKDAESGVHGLRVTRKDSPGKTVFLPCEEEVTEETSYPAKNTTVIKRTWHGRYWTLDEDTEDNAFLVHICFTRTETITGEESSLSEFSRGLSGGTELCEFTSVPKTELHATRTIIKETI